MNVRAQKQRSSFFFRNVKDGLNTNINVAAIVSGHSKTRAYCHRVKIMEPATCPCNDRDQTEDRLVKQRSLLHTSRELGRNKVYKYYEMAHGKTKDTSK